MDADNPFRAEQSAALLEKLYMMGLIPTKWDLSLCQKVTASSFCRRRLPIVMIRNKMSETIKMATQLIEQGHVRVGPEVIKDPAFLVTRYYFYSFFINMCLFLMIMNFICRNLEDFVTWIDTSAIKRHVMEYSNTVSLYI